MNNLDSILSSLKFDDKGLIPAVMQDLRVAPLEVPDIQTASLTVPPLDQGQVVSNR